MVRTVTIAALLCATASLASTDPASNRTRRAFETVMQRVNGTLPRTGPSLTRCVSDLISCGEEEVRLVLTEFWQRADEKRSAAWWAAEDVELLVRFLFGVPEQGEPDGGISAGFKVVGGAILHEMPDGFDYSGPGYRPELPRLSELLQEGILRPPPKPDARQLLWAIRVGVSKEWSTSAREGLYSALGEAARDDPEVAAKLIEFFRSTSEDRCLALALGRANTRECREALLGVVLDAASRLAGGSVPEREELSLRTRLRWTAEQLAAVATEEFRRALASATRHVRQKLLELIGLHVSVPLLLTDFERAESNEDRLAVWESLRAVIVAQDGLQLPKAADVPKLLDLFLSLSPELQESERLRLWRVAEMLFYPHNRFPLRSSSATNDLSITEQGASIGPYPDMETIARRLRQDIAADRLLLIDPGERPGVFAPPTRLLSTESERAHSDIPPRRGMSGLGAGFPVHVRARWKEEGLEIEFTNRGVEPYLLSPLIERYAKASLTTVRLREGDEERTYRQLSLDLGTILLLNVIPREALIRLDPGETHSWIQRVRDEHRDVAHIVISFVADAPILGGTELPYLQRLSATWIR